MRRESPNNHRLAPQSPCPQPDPASFPPRSGLWCLSGWSPSGWQPRSPHRRYGPWRVAWQTQSKSARGGHLCCYCCSGKRNVQGHLLGSRHLQVACDPPDTSLVKAREHTFQLNMTSFFRTGKGKHHGTCILVLGSDLEPLVDSCISVAVNQYSLPLQIASYDFWYLTVSIHSAESALSRLILWERSCYYSSYRWEN